MRHHQHPLASSCQDDDSPLASSFPKPTRSRLGSSLQSTCLSRDCRATLTVWGKFVGWVECNEVHHERYRSWWASQARPTLHWLASLFCHIREVRFVLAEQLHDCESGAKPIMRHDQHLLASSFPKPTRSGLGSSLQSTCLRLDCTARLKVWGKFVRLGRVQRGPPGSISLLAGLANSTNPIAVFFWVERSRKMGTGSSEGRAVPVPFFRLDPSDTVKRKPL